MTLGMDLIKVPGATGDYSTDFNAKGQACIQHITSDKYDFGFCHLKAVDDAGHDKDVQKKVSSLFKHMTHTPLNLIRFITLKELMK